MRPTTKSIREYIEGNEGRESRLYKCTKSKQTIGVGRNLSANGVNQDEIDLMFTNDLDLSFRALWNVFSTRTVDDMPPRRRMALMDLMFNIGEPRFRTFKKMIAAVKEDNWELAIVELLDSAYARQLPTRARKNACLLKGEGTKK